MPPSLYIYTPLKLQLTPTISNIYQEIFQSQCAILASQSKLHAVEFSSRRYNFFLFQNSITKVDSVFFFILCLFNSWLMFFSVFIYFSNEFFHILFLGVGKMKYDGESPKLELKLNLSPPGEQRQVVSPKGAISSREISPRSSCVSRETSPDGTLGYSSGPEAISMMLVGCPRCLMYVMLFQDDPKCPKCKSTVLLNFVQKQEPHQLNVLT